MIVSAWGNSLGVRLPKALVIQLDLKAGDELEVVAATPSRIELRKDARRQQAVDRMRARRLQIPADYRFDRESLHER